MCLYLSSAGDDSPFGLDEAIRSSAAETRVQVALDKARAALGDLVEVGADIASGSTDRDLDQSITDAERAIGETVDRLFQALAAQARGEEHRLLDLHRGGLGRALRFRLAQNRTVAAIEVDAARQAAVSAGAA